MYRGSKCQQGVLWFDVSLVGVLTVEYKLEKPDLEESLPGILTTLFPTVALHGSLKRDVFQKYDTVQSKDGFF
jgi:hypothetical protein